MKNSPGKKKLNRHEVGSLLLDTLLCILGTFSYALGVVYFINPVQFVPGGLTTLGILVNHLVPFVPIGAFVFLVNVPLFIISWRKFGTAFIGKTVFSTALLSIFIDVLTNVCAKHGWLYSGDEKLVKQTGLVKIIGLAVISVVSGLLVAKANIQNQWLRLLLKLLCVPSLVLLFVLMVCRR